MKGRPAKMHAPSTALVLYRPGRTCQRVATAVADAISPNGDTPILPMQDFPLTFRGSVFLVFPVLGDERLPDDVEAWLRAGSFRGVSVAVCLVGDFVLEREPCPVAVEAIRLLRDGGAWVRPTALHVDSTFIGLAEGAKAWLVQAAMAGGQPDAMPANELTCHPEPPGWLVRERSWRRLLSLVASPPRAKGLGDGWTLDLAMVTASPYPRSLLYGLPQSSIEDVWRCLMDLPVRQLRIPFAALDIWPRAAVAKLELLAVLDIRGNAMKDWEFLGAYPGLSKLNLSGCGLDALPSAVFEISGLQALIACKNRLAALPADIGRLRGLARLSIYRNLIAFLPPELAQCTQLRRLNVGANPLRSLPDALGALLDLEELILRNCTLDTLPAFLSRLPRLTHLDLAKTIVGGRVP